MTSERKRDGHRVTGGPSESFISVNPELSQSPYSDILTKEDFLK